MAFLLLLPGLFAMVFGIAIFRAANGAIQEIEGFLCFLIAAVLLGTSFIVDAIGKHRRQTLQALSELRKGRRVADD